jgi:transposase
VGRKRISKRQRLLLEQFSPDLLEQLAEVHWLREQVRQAEALDPKRVLAQFKARRSRQLLVRQRTMLSNAIRGHLAELGIISAKGRNGTVELFKIIADEKDGRIPAAARFSLDVLARQHAAIAAEIGTIEKRIHAWHRSSEESRRLEQIPGVGPVVATALVSEVGDWKEFSSGRSLAAWIGLVPKQHSTGGKERLGRISKQGNRYLRWLLVTGAMAVIRYARQHGTRRLCLRILWNAGRSRSPPWRLPIRSRAWPGP